MILPRLTLKRRVVWALTLLVMLFVALQGSLAYLSLAEQEDDLVDELVQAEAERLAILLEKDQAPPNRLLQPPMLGPNFSAWLVTPTATWPAVPPAYVRALANGPHRYQQGSAELHAYVLPTHAGRLFLLYDAARNEAKVHEFGLYLLGLGLLCGALAIFAARQLAAVVVAPIERLSQHLATWAPAATQIDESNRDEEARLLAAFQRVQARFEQRLAHEQEFMANARHEIRTPLTALRTDLEILALQTERQAGSATPVATPSPAVDARLTRALQKVDEIAAALELAQSLARVVSGTPERIDLARCVDDAWNSLVGTLDSSPLQFDNQVGPDVQVVADRHALLTILRNLIRNAAEHAAARQCTVRHGSRGIEVLDDGQGIAATDLPLVFERHYRGHRLDAVPATQPPQTASTASQERGLGLAIARQLSELHGWTLSVESTATHGCCFILALGEQSPA